jgi:hypothetical protein
MEQRRLRLGDILDDYCPRERRVTNHAIVAMVEEDVKQTRCTTCDAEHAYKGARVPKRRKKEVPAALYKEVLAGMPDVDALPALAAPVVVAAPVVGLPEAATIVPLPAAAPAPRATAEDEEMDDDLGPAAIEAAEAPDATYEAEAGPPPDEGPVHRPLIRATLPRPEGAQKDTRPAPEFTIRQNVGRHNGGSHFRGDRVKMRGAGDSRSRGGQGAGANGNRAQAAPRFGRPGRGGPQAGFRGGQPRHGGKKGRG